MQTMSSQKTIVFFCLEALGHVNPLISIALELKKRGHRCMLVTLYKPHFIPILESTGLEFAFCQDQADKSKQPRDFLEDLFKVFEKGPESAFKVTYGLEGALDNTLSTLIDNHDLLEAKLRTLKPDLIVVDYTVGVPCTTYVAPKWIRVYSGFPSLLYSSYNNEYVAGIGLKYEDMTERHKKEEIEIKKPIKAKILEFFNNCKAMTWDSPIDLVPTSPYANFYFGPQELSLEQNKSLKKLPDKWMRLEQTIFHEKTNLDFKLPTKLENLSGKTIYFSLGTLVSTNHQMINRLLEFLSKSNNKFIISTGKCYADIKLFSNMWGEEFVDQKQILRHADLFLSHCGHNSVIESFYYGVPMVCLPVFADQFDCSQQIEECGFGYRLNPFHCTEEDLLTTIDKVLNDKEMRAKYKAVSHRLQSKNYSAIAATKVDEILNTK